MPRWRRIHDQSPEEPSDLHCGVQPPQPPSHVHVPPPPTPTGTPAFRPMSFELRDWPPPLRSTSPGSRVPGFRVEWRSTRECMQLSKNGVAALLVPSMVPTGTPFSYNCSVAAPEALVLQTVSTRVISSRGGGGGGGGFWWQDEQTSQPERALSQETGTR